VKRRSSSGRNTCAAASFLPLLLPLRHVIGAPSVLRLTRIAVAADNMLATLDLSWQ